MTLSPVKKHRIALGIPKVVMARCLSLGVKEYCKLEEGVPPPYLAEIFPRLEAQVLAIKSVPDTDYWSLIKWMQAYLCH